MPSASIANVSNHHRVSTWPDSRYYRIASACKNSGFSAGVFGCSAVTPSNTALASTAASCSTSLVHSACLWRSCLADAAPRCTSSICQLRPTSRGHLSIDSPDPLARPKIHPGYLSTTHDQHTLVAALRVTRHIAEQPALKKFIVDEYKPGAQAQSDEELLEFARDNGVTIFHPAGTCKMGVGSDAVVDPTLKVRGVRGLRVVDCSIMPTLVSGNTHAPVVMIAEKASDLILAEAD